MAIVFGFMSAPAAGDITSHHITGVRGLKMGENAHAYSDSELFKMGAAVAIAELFAMGYLGNGNEGATEVQKYLKSFGISRLDDIVTLGIKGPYMDDFQEIYAG